MVAQVNRGGKGSNGGTIFAFSGTSGNRLTADALQALGDLGYQGKGEITVISDGEDCLTQLSANLPQPATHILDWFHIAMKIRPLEQMAARFDRLEHGRANPKLTKWAASLKWRLWNGQPDRAIRLIDRLIRESFPAETDDLIGYRIYQGLTKLRTYVTRNTTSIPNYGKRYRAGKRIATTAAEGHINCLLAHRMVKKQQMRWSKQGAHLLPQVRAALANGTLAQKLVYEPPSRRQKPLIWPFAPMPLFDQAA